MTARSRMTQRAVVQRATTSGTDDSGNPNGPATWATHIAALACWLYGSTEKEAVAEETTAVVTDLRLMVPLATDVTEQDRIAGVTDRRGTVIEAGILEIDTVLQKRSHLQLSLTRVAS
jgi:hypothetical protein